MFTTMSSSSRTSPGLADAYRQVGVETGISGATPHKLIQMLFDGFQDAVAQARGAMRNRLIEAKGRAIGRALGIVEDGLHASLNTDQGGALAANLGALYGYVAHRLTQANLNNDEAALDECLALMEPLRQAWTAIGPQVDSPRQ